MHLVGISGLGVFDVCLNFTRVEEGGYTCSPADSGNWSTGLAGQGRLVGSNMGVSAPPLISWLGRDADAVDQEVMKTLSEVTYQAIARARYWRSLGCDGLAPAVAMMVFDYGWNVGVGKSARLLQATLGLQGSAIDGDLGPQTQTAASSPNWTFVLAKLSQSSIKRLQAECGQAQDGIAGPETLSACLKRPALWPLVVALRLGEEQIEAYKQLRNFELYGKGWLDRTDRRVDAACQMASA